MPLPYSFRCPGMRQENGEGEGGQWSPFCHFLVPD